MPSNQASQSKRHCEDWKSTNITTFLSTCEKAKMKPLFGSSSASGFHTQVRIQRTHWEMYTGRLPFLIWLGCPKLHKNHLIIPRFHFKRSLQNQKAKRIYSKNYRLSQILPCLHFSHFTVACKKFAGPAQSHRFTLDYFTRKFSEDCIGL